MASRRNKRPDGPGSSPYDADLQAVGEDIDQRANNLLAAIHNGAGPRELLWIAADVQRSLQDFTALNIARGRAGGQTWDQLGAPLGFSGERLRKKWPMIKIMRRLDTYRNSRATRQAGQPAVPPALPSPRRPPAEEADTDSDTATAAPFAAQTPPQQLAGALSFLQRRTGKPLRQTAAETGISPSHLSRLLAGTRRPSWPVAKNLVAACDGNPHEIRPLWENAHRPTGPLPPPTPPTSTFAGDPGRARDQLRDALRGLYLAAEQPELRRIRAATAHTLSTDHIACAFTSPHLLDWSAMSRLVFALGGRPADLRPLWHTATHHHLMAEAFG
ncbi:helix-turn-helix domain-containing protein [Streptomyces melanogenes]|uniref:helix-turn-helix domain-containing protein n=1 Tax=Streptomyces melanogenes TaxID=67326 RepID=UPI00167DF175|nr:helix-turn-helix domain-containing protein [Streptomyces melanogenes]